MTFTIKDKDVELKFNFKSELLYEEVAKESFTGQTTASWITMFYCCLVATEGDAAITYSDFVDYLSENPQVFYDFVAWYSETLANIATLATLSRDESAKKKGKRKAGKVTTGS